MSFFGKLFNHLVSDAAVSKLANSTLMRTVAAKVIEAEKHVATHAETIAKDPGAAKAAVKEEAGKVWEHLKGQVLRDLENLTGRKGDGKK